MRLIHLNGRRMSVNAADDRGIDDQSSTKILAVAH